MLADAAGYEAWLGRSGTYRGTRAPSSQPFRAGDRYTERISLGTVHGEVLEARRPEVLVFRQGTESGSLELLIRYAFAVEGSGTRLERTGELTTRGALALLHPIVVRATRRENERSMRALATRVTAR